MSVSVTSYLWLASRGYEMPFNSDYLSSRFSECEWRNSVFVFAYLITLLGVYMKVTSSFFKWLHPSDADHPQSIMEEIQLNHLRPLEVPNEEVYAHQELAAVGGVLTQPDPYDNQALNIQWGQGEDLDIPVDHLELIVELYAMLENIKDHVPTFLW